MPFPTPPALDPPDRPRARRDGFTLIELLVASGVTVLLVGFMVAVIGNVSGFWTRSSGRLSAEAQARYALDQLTLDLQSARFRDTGTPWLAASIPTNTATSTLWNTTGATTANLKPASAAGITPPISYGARGIADATFGPSGTWLRFFTTKRGSNTVSTVIATDVLTYSSPVAVGWQIIRRASSTNAGNTDRRYFLHRSEVRPAQTSATTTGTLENGYDITVAAYAGTAVQSGNTGNLGDPRSVRTPQSLDTIVAENVVDFGVYFYTQPAPGAASSALVRIFPSGSETTHFATTPPRVGATTTQFPEVADVMIRVLTDEGATLIAAFEAGRLPVAVGRTNAQYWWDLALAHSQVFTRRINLRVQPL